MSQQKNQSKKTEQRNKKNTRRKQSQYQRKRDDTPGMNETQLIVSVMLALFFVMAITFAFSNYLARQDEEARKRFEDYLLTEEDEPTNFKDDPAKYAPPADRVDKNGVKTFKIAGRTYTFGLTKQPENCPGICLNPTCSVATQEAPVGFLLTPVGCDLRYGQSSQEERIAPVVLLNGYDPLREKYPIQFIDADDFGVAWDLNTLAGAESSQDESAVIVRSVDLQTNCMMDIMQLNFGFTTEGKYSLLEVVDPTIKDEQLLLMIAEELNRMVSLDLCNEKLQRYVPVKIGGDFLSPEMRNSFCVQKVAAPYEDHYINAVTQQEEHRSAMEGIVPTYAVTVNFGGAGAFITMYMTEKTDDAGNPYAETVGYWRAKAK